MSEFDIYRDIAERTHGNLYIGVVGPVRTGKSTFIKRFMESLVIPAIAEEHNRTRAKDELPQSAGGKTVMTTEPKFIPDEAVSVTFGENTSVRIRMIDCVGYIVPGAIGNYEDDAPRMVHTPWSETPILFDEAAEIGTHKVISEHATIGVLVTTDGSIGELPREAYKDAEARVVRELKEEGKPFVIVLNSADPSSVEARTLGLAIEAEYNAPVALVSCTDMNAEDIRHILGLVLEAFPIREIGILCPAWFSALPQGHRIRTSVCEMLTAAAPHIRKTGDAAAVMTAAAAECEALSDIRVERTAPGTGSVVLSLLPPEDLFFRVLGEETGFPLENDSDLFTLLSSLAEVKREYDRVSRALTAVREQGYGIVMPELSELKLNEPEIVRQNGSWGVRLKATAPSIHMIRANIEAQIAPIVGTPLGGTEQQSEEMAKYLLHEFEEEPAKLWATNMFGKSLYEMVGEGLHAKLANMPDDARRKIGETIERIINEGSGGLICILL